MRPRTPWSKRTRTWGCGAGEGAGEVGANLRLRGWHSVYDSPSYPKPGEEEVRRFAEAQPYAVVLAQAASGFPSASLLPFRFTAAHTLEIHMVQEDPTYRGLRDTGRGSVLFEEFLAFTPHSLVDPDYAGMATLHFRAVLYEVTAEVSEDPREVSAVLARLLDRYEPGASYHALSDLPFYEGDLSRLACARLTIHASHVKFKTAQNRTPEERERVLAYLRSRNLPRDGHAADVIETEGRGSRP